MAQLHELLAFYVGDTWDIDFACFYRDGTPFNLGNGAAAEWTLKDATGNTIFDLTIGNGGIAVVDGPNGKCLISLSTAQTAPLVPGRYSDRLRCTDPSGLVSTQALGSIDVRA